ncbi:MAG: nuclear transport factor 2 family protein [Actinomycetes bacterium]
MSSLSFAEVSAGVHHALAAYTQALDDGRTDDLVATFCIDGGCDMPGLGVHEGREAIRAAYGRFTPRRPQRHVIVNTLILDWNDDEVTASSDIVFLLRGDGGWSVQMVGRYDDVLHRDGSVWRFHHRRATFVE